MKAFAALCVVAIVCVLALIAVRDNARADFRFCNETTSDSHVMEGHDVANKGLTVTGTYTVRKGTCGVIVPGRLQSKRYFFRVIWNGEEYGDHRNQLCIYDMAHFTIEDEESPHFHCRGTAMPEDVHIPGFVNERMHLAPFMAVITNGEANLLVTQRKTGGFHFQLK